jgi:D-alanyl-D-alanine carboxypeptidase
MFYGVIVMNQNQINIVSQDLAQELQATLQQTAEDVGLFDMAVSVGVVTKYGNWAGANGIANLKTLEATETGDLFNIGSISKSYTSAVILKLQEQGKLSLDDTLGEWLPEIAARIPDGDNLTLRQLLNGTGGVFDYANSEEFLSDLIADYFLGEMRDWQPEDLVAYAFDKPLFSGGVSDIWTYPNTGNVIATLIAEAATGKFFEQILTEEILQPLGLDNTFFTTEDVDVEQRARGYDDYFRADGSIGEDGVLEEYTDVETTWAIGAGSIVATAEDVAIFFDALASGELLKFASTDEIFNYVNTGVPGFEFGMGVFPGEYTWSDSRRMTGGLFGYSSNVDYFLRDDITVSVLLNRNGAKAELTAFAYKAAIANTLNLGNAFSLKGTENNDYLPQTSGDDVVDGFGGDDTIFGAEGKDILDGGEGNDFLKGNQGSDLLFGAQGKDILDGGKGDDFLNGGRGNDILEGGKGNDYLLGGKGKDFLDGAQGDDILDGGAGNDLVKDSQGNNILYGNWGNDSLFSGRGEDILYGEMGNDYLDSGSGDDILIGGAGKDTLKGSGGINTLTGGNGRDTFILSVEGTDIITDFEDGKDLLQLPDTIDFKDLQIIQNDSNALINFQEQTLVILNNFNTEKISASDFILSNNSQTLFEFMGF